MNMTDQMTMPSRYGAQEQDIPMTGPTATDIMSQPRPITNQADLAQSGIIGNTMAAKVNKRAKDMRFEDMQESFLELVKQGKKAADIAYNGAPEAFKDPDIQQYLPKPDDPAWIDPQTGTFKFVDYSKQFNADLQNYRKWKFELSKQDAMTERQDRRDAASMERARMSHEVAVERNKISWANNALGKQNFLLSQNKEITDILLEAGKVGIAKQDFIQKMVTPQYDKWTNQEIPLTEAQKEQAKKVIQAYDEHLLNSENAARWAPISVNPGQRYQYQPSSPAPAGMVPVGGSIPPPRDTPPAPVPAPSSQAPAPVPAPAAQPAPIGKPLTQEAILQAKSIIDPVTKLPLDKAAAMKWLASQGYNVNE